MNDETKDIVSEMFYKDVANIVCSYLYVTCDLCETEILQDNSVDGVLNIFYCNTCIQKARIKKCHCCNKFYDFIKYLYPCPVCIGGCVIYCNYCFRSTDDIMFGEVYDNEHINYYYTIFDRMYHQHQS